MQSRSKLDRETVNKFGSEDRSAPRRTPVNLAEEESNRATSAIVTLNLAIEGDSTQMPGITLRTDLRTALQRIAADAQVEDCLLSAEILWVPDDRNDVLDADDVYAAYPKLIPL